MNEDATIMLQSEVNSPHCNLEIVKGLVAADADVSAVDIRVIEDRDTRKYLTACFHIKKIKRILGRV